MKTTAFAALGALLLAAGATPAMAGGYWDGGIVDEGPPVDSRYDDSCPCNCPDVQESRGEERGWREHTVRAEDSGWREDNGWREDDGYRQEDRDVEQDQDYAPADYYEDNGGVGPNTWVDEASGGGSSGFAGANGIAVASAFADANVDVNVDIRDRERMRHDHDMHHQHMMQPYPPKHDQPMHGYPPTQHEHQPMPPMHGYPPMQQHYQPPMQHYQPMQPMRGWGAMGGGVGGMGGWHAGGHPAMAMHRSGGGRR